MRTGMMTDSDRSRLMRSIRKKDTKPELLVRRMVHQMGLRYRLHRADLPGSPDLVLPRHRKIIFVHGCFWHQHAGCRLGKQPRSRLDYWIPKLKRNVVRDLWAKKELSARGWHVLVVWECEQRDPEQLLFKLRSFLKPS